MDKKVTQLTAATYMRPQDLFMIVQDPNGSPVNKKSTNKTVFGDIRSNTVISASTFTVGANTTINGIVVFNAAANSGNDLVVKTAGDAQAFFVDAGNNSVGIGTTLPQVKLDINSDKFRVRTPKTPVSSNAVASAVPSGTIFYDSSYLYIAVNGNTIKRVALSSF